MLQTAGPIRNDGSDKFFGMENVCCSQMNLYTLANRSSSLEIHGTYAGRLSHFTTNTRSYCNSIVQALYYSTPFREHVVRYPAHSPADTPNGFPQVNVPIRAPPPPVAPTSPGGKSKGISSSEALKRRQAINSGQPIPASPGQRPEDKPDSPEYKKKHAVLAGPVLDIMYETASKYGMEESTFTALKDIFLAAIQSQFRTGVLSPQRFLEIFKRENEMFRTSMHQDAHEFYGLVLNAVISNVEADARRVKEIAPKNDGGLVDSMKAAVTQAAAAMGLESGMRTPGTGWVHDIFEGVLTSETKCLTCETASQRDETFLDLSIDLEEHSSVTSCLRKFSAEEMLCERNKFHCDNCGGLQEAEKRMKIKRLPKILALHLKRFKYTEDMTRLQKLFHRVVYPYHLRMFNTTDDAEDADRLYELYAVVVHIGGNAYHGHYVSVIKTQDRGWLLFDDEMVEPVDKNYVRNFFGDKPGMACAYVLFYQETTVEAMKKEQEADGLAEVALATQEADAAAGNPVPNGTHPSSISKAVSLPGSPVDNHQEFVSLDHAITEPRSPGSPQPISPTGIPPVPPLPQSPVISPPPSSVTATTAALSPTVSTAKKAKEEKEREKKELKEAEKARKLAEKAAIKEKEKARLDAAIERREINRVQTENFKKAMEESKKSVMEDEERRRLGGSGSVLPPPSTATTESAPSEAGNSIVAEKDVKENTSKGFLNRTHKGSKSMSRKSFNFLGGKSNGHSGNGVGNGAANGTGEGSLLGRSATERTPSGKVDEAGDVDTASHTQTTEKVGGFRGAKERFSSFGGLGKKKSHVFS